MSHGWKFSLWCWLVGYSTVTRQYYRRTVPPRVDNNRIIFRITTPSHRGKYRWGEFLQHFLLEYSAYTNIRDQNIPENVDSMNVLFMYCLDFTELSPLHKLQQICLLYKFILLFYCSQLTQIIISIKYKWLKFQCSNRFCLHTKYVHFSN
jgi:hypothetical protein